MKRIVSLLVVAFCIAKSPSVWAATVKQLAELTGNGRSFGDAVAMTGTTIVVGAASHRMAKRPAHCRAEAIRRGSVEPVRGVCGP